MNLTSIPTPIESELMVYPNPSTGLVNVDLGDEVSRVELTITELLGRIVFRESFTNTSSVRMDLSGLGKGAYILNTVSEDGAVSTPLVLN